MKNVYVSDSFHTKGIAAFLQKLYGNNATVVCELNFTPPDYDIQGGFIKKVTDATEHYENPQQINRIDLFFVSARAVLTGQIDISDLKKRYGNPAAKVVVMSVLSDYLEDVKNGNYEVDYFHPKNRLQNAKELENLSIEERNQLLHYLN